MLLAQAGRQPHQESCVSAHTLAGTEVQMPASGQARRHPPILTTGDSLGTEFTVHEEIPCWQLQTAGFCPAGLQHTDRTRAPLLQGHLEPAADIHPANSGGKQRIESKRLQSCTGFFY